MASKRRRPSDDDVPKNVRDCDRRDVKRRRYHEDEKDRILWPPEKFDLTYVAWARQQFPETGFCLDYRARWLKSRHACPLCDKYVIRKAGDIDRLCKDDEIRTAVSEEFSTELGVETLENIEYIMCSKPHGAHSFGYVRTEGNTTEVEAIFEGIFHLGWPEFSALLETDQFADLIVDLNEQCLTLKLTPKVAAPLDADEIGMALVGYYLRSNDTAPVPVRRDAL